jgi:hypothetical protein
LCLSCKRTHDNDLTHLGYSYFLSDAVVWGDEEG